MNATLRPKLTPRDRDALQAPPLLLLAPMRIEARALRGGAPGARVLRTGIGARRSERAAAVAGALPSQALAVAGFGGGLDDTLQPGDVVVASEIRDGDGELVLELAGADTLAGMMRRRGLRASAAPVCSVTRLVTGQARPRLRRCGALVAEMESAWLAPAAGERPFAVVRVVLDTPLRELRDARHAARAVTRAYRSLRAASGVLEEWAAAVRPRELVLASPRASCAGVERAIDIVEQALERYGAPVYVRKQIVHNAHVVADLAARGAVFVDELDEVPSGSTVVFSAHGVSPAVRASAELRELRVIDATCPLVNKVHAEARRFAADGYTIVLVGHEGHEEVEGTAGEAPERTRLVDNVEGVADVEVEDPARVAWLTQTTLAVDETRAIVDAIRGRFPQAIGPRSDDICYATQNRQDAVKALGASCDVVLVVGSANSSNSNRLVEVAERSGARALLIEDESGIEPEWLADAARVGITAGASTPERLVQRVLRALEALGPLTVAEHSVAAETVSFKLPPDLRH